VPLFFIPVLLFGLIQMALIFGFQKIFRKAVDVKKTLKLILPMTILYFLGTYFSLIISIGVGFSLLLVIPLIWLLAAIALNLQLIKKFTGSITYATIIFLISGFLAYFIFLIFLGIFSLVAGPEKVFEFFGLEVEAFPQKRLEEISKQEMVSFINNLKPEKHVLPQRHGGFIEFKPRPFSESTLWQYKASIKTFYRCFLALPPTKLRLMP
jgi:hypothetical protein